MYFKDLSNIKKISKSIERNGISIIKKFVDKKSIFEISKKVEGILNKPHLIHFFQVLSFCFLNIHNCQFHTIRKLLGF